MSDRILFWIPTLIWASTWHVILYQLGAVPPLNSVAYRFGIASLMLFIIAAARRMRLAFAPQTHGWLALAGALQYGASYWAVYVAEQHLPSGLVAVLFSLLVFGNAAAGALWFAQPVSRAFFAAATLGTAGVAMIFWPEVAAASARPTAAFGLAIGLGSVATSLAGSILTLKLRRRASRCYRCSHGRWVTGRRR